MFYLFLVIIGSVIATKTHVNSCTNCKCFTCALNHNGNLYNANSRDMRTYSSVLFENENNNIMRFTNKLFDYEQKLNELKNTVFGEVTETIEIQHLDSKIKMLEFKIMLISNELEKEFKTHKF